jgi:hypothetical protein
VVKSTCPALSACGCEFAFKGVTDETLTNPTFQESVRKAYACGDFAKLFHEFDAARVTARTIASQIDSS